MRSILLYVSPLLFTTCIWIFTCWAEYIPRILPGCGRKFDLWICFYHQLSWVNRSKSFSHLKSEVKNWSCKVHRFLVKTFPSSVRISWSMQGARMMVPQPSKRAGIFLFPVIFAAMFAVFALVSRRVYFFHLYYFRDLPFLNVLWIHWSSHPGYIEGKK